MFKNIAIPVQTLFLLAFRKKNVTNASMINSVNTYRKTHRHHFHAGCTLAI